MSLPEFAAAFRARWLPTHWHQDIALEIRSSQVKPGEKISEYVDRIMDMNTILVDTTSHLSDVDLRNLLEAAMLKSSQTFKTAYRDVKAKDVVPFQDWLEAVSTAEDDANERQQAFLEYAAENRRQARATRPLASPTRARAPSSSRPNRPTSNRLPQLKEEERTLLYDHQGCLKCRQFYVGHISRDCPNDYPSGSTYKTLTLADALRAKPSGRTNDRPKTSRPCRCRYLQPRRLRAHC
ncbi:hypothetical protein DL96DRAFT_875324 [Flagelloscypha sp. PMI_526]|nr:hypothetical protein DL96DRAFT_875324 [Flagelloscypha sp. PMI_526]